MNLSIEPTLPWETKYLRWLVQQFCESIVSIKLVGKDLPEDAIKRFHGQMREQPGRVARTLGSTIETLTLDKWPKGKLTPPPCPGCLYELAEAAADGTFRAMARDLFGEGTVRQVRFWIDRPFPRKKVYGGRRVAAKSFPGSAFITFCNNVPIMDGGTVPDVPEGTDPSELTLPEGTKIPSVWGFGPEPDTERLAYEICLHHTEGDAETATALYLDVAKVLGSIEADEWSLSDEEVGNIILAATAARKEGRP
jgi:hypothetical protein